MARPSRDRPHLAEEAADARETPGQEVILPSIRLSSARRNRHPARKPGPGRLRINTGGPREENPTTAPRASSIAKKTPVEAVNARPNIKPNDVVISPLPKARADGPGMREMHPPGHRRHCGAGLSDSVALVTDGRFSGATHGFHDRPRGSRGLQRRPIAVVAEGDPHHGGCGQGRNRYRHLRPRSWPAPAAWKPRAPRYKTGLLPSTGRASLLGLRRRQSRHPCRN